MSRLTPHQGCSLGRPISLRCVCRSSRPRRLAPKAVRVHESGRPARNRSVPGTSSFRLASRPKIWKTVTPAGSRGVFRRDACWFNWSRARPSASICSVEPLSLGPSELQRALISSRTAFLLALRLCSSRQMTPRPEAFQPAVDDLERGHLLGDEQDFLTLLDRGGDDVGDGLRLAGPGRTLDDQAAARAGLPRSRRPASCPRR